MYTTQMDAAKKGIITKEMKVVAREEDVSIDFLIEKMSKGEIIIPANKNHISLVPKGIGSGLSTKINVNIGISQDANDVSLEIDKAKLAIELEADAIMDLSNYGDTEGFRQELIRISPMMVGTVPIYDALSCLKKELLELTAKDFLNVARKHAQDGVDFLTIHAGLTTKVANTFIDNPRLMNIVSRGGSLLFAWMNIHKEENPFYQNFDELLDICQEFDVTLSLGDGMRPGGIYDATDASQIDELITLGTLTKRAWGKNVQVMIEGPGHIPINEIKTNIQLAKSLCHNAPFYVLGPLVTDIAPGYDHITGAIGGALAAWHGADFLCYLTPAEHLRLPDLSDVKEGIIASKIAAHAGDIAKGSKEIEWDHKMSLARVNLDWDKMTSLALDSEKVKKYREGVELKDSSTCSMCGKMCAIRNVKKIIDGENVNIYK
ncbi:MAG: phosphomethylpyrimidine synthase ThiC [Clostridia bacterium]